MRNITYTILTMGDDMEASGSVANLLQDIPYFLVWGIPSLSVVNSVLKKGLDDAGMSGGVKWQPFELDEKEFAEVVAELNKTGLQELSPPEWVVDQEDLMVWVFEEKHGVPVQKHKKLNDECKAIERQLTQALDTNNNELADDLHLKYISKSRELEEFLNPYIMK